MVSEFGCKEYISFEDAMRMLGRSKRTVHHLIQTGRIRTPVPHGQGTVIRGGGKTPLSHSMVFLADVQAYADAKGGMTGYHFISDAAAQLEVPAHKIRYLAQTRRVRFCTKQGRLAVMLADCIEEMAEGTCRERGGEGKKAGRQKVVDIFFTEDECNKS